MLCGTSRLGKTQWARSLGPHAYIANMWDLTAFDGLCSSFWNTGYVIFDDLKWDSIKDSAKSWFGAQRDFSVSDKYKRKRRMPGGVPVIFLVNPEDCVPDFLEFLHSSWGKANIVYVLLNDKLYTE